MENGKKILSNFLDKTSLVKPKQEDVEMAKQSFSNISQNNYWDPTNFIDFERINKNCIKILSKLFFLKRNPDKPKKQISIASLILIVGTVGVFLLNFNSSIKIDPDAWLMYLLFAIFPLTFILIDYQSLSKDIIKIQVAQSNNFLYDPYSDYKKWFDLSKLYPEIFQKGNSSQHVEDQFWGSLTKNSIDHYFYSGIFTYTIRTQNGKNSSSTTYNTHFFSIKLNKKINTRFCLCRESIFSRFSKKEINTESIEFNKRFSFLYDGKKSEKSLEIVKQLSPAVQEKIIELDKKTKGMNILFTQDCVIFLFTGFLLKRSKTNLFKSVEINEEDKNFISNKLDTLIDISSDISHYLD